MILFDNALATMRGPQFLVVYAVIIALVLVGCWMATRLNEASHSAPPPPIPSAPDPYEIAYLRGGENEVVRLAIFNLLQRGHLEIAGSSGHRRLKRKLGAGGLDELSPLERAAYDALPISMNARDVFHGSLPKTVKTHCRVYEHRLQHLQLLADVETLGARWLIRLGGALIIFGLGAYKLFAALSTGHFNVLFLIVMDIAGLIVLFVLLRGSRLSGRGRAYLRDLQTAFARLKFEPATIAPQTGTFDPNLLLLAGVFGMTALSGTAYAGYPQMFGKSSDGSSGSACGGTGGGDGGGSGCGGGCGGCGS